MSYVITSYSYPGNITIPTGTADQSNTSLTLIGRNWTSSNASQGFGQALNQNFVSLLENFASTTTPSNPIKGQLWFNPSGTTGSLSVYNNSSSWSTFLTTASVITNISHGTSNVNIPNINGNVNTSVNGVANVFVVSSSGANVSGTLGVSGNVTAGNVSGTLLTGTLTTAAQPNITSVGTLSGLTINGTTNLSAVGNVKITGGSSGQVLSTDGAGNLSFTSVSTSSISNGSSSVSIPVINDNIVLTSAGNAVVSVAGYGATITGTLLATSTATVGNLTTTGNVSGGNLIATSSANVASLSVTGTSNLGAVGNVTITGGSSGQLLQTNGSGVLTWASVNTSSISNGTSNVTIATSGGSVVTNVNGSTMLTVGSTGANLSGYINVANITTGAAVTQGNITGNWTLTSGSRLNATYADLAEYYTVEKTSGIVGGPGSVVEFGGTAEIRICDTDMSTRIAGVISTEPAYLMNCIDDGLAKEPVALQGRVPCKVIGKTKKGDLMVSAGSGYARAEENPKIGSVIGKSLEDKDTDEMGVIEIVVGRL